MLTTRNFIGVFIVLTTGVQHGHYYLKRRTAFLGMNACRNTTAIIFYRNRIILVYGNNNIFTMAGKGFVNGIIYNLVHKMVQTFYANIAYIHSGTFANGFEAF